MGGATSPAGVVRARLEAMLDRAVATRVPLNGSIAMTHRCNLRCVHCYLGNERWAPPAGELDTAFWHSVVDQVAEAGCMELLITGGEPLVRRDFARVYTRARERGIMVTVFTAATLIDERIADLFADLPPHLVEVSLYGASEETYERVTGIRGSYRRCIEGVDRLLARGVAVGLKSVILRENQHEMSAARKIATERGVSFRVDAALFPRFDGDRSPLDHRVDAAIAVEIEMEDRELLRQTAGHFMETRDVSPEDRLFSCFAGVTGFHVDAHGTLLPCLMVPTHGYDLRRGTFREGWEGLSGFHDQALPAGYGCHDCDMRFLCGSCPAQAGRETGSPHQKADYFCGLGKARLEATSGALGPAAPGSPWQRIDATGLLARVRRPNGDGAGMMGMMGALDK
jgi:radical SAM protein with 4Fe4S-binding SPASM domain